MRNEAACSIKCIDCCGVKTSKYIFRKISSRVWDRLVREYKYVLAIRTLNSS